MVHVPEPVQHLDQSFAWSTLLHTILNEVLAECCMSVSSDFVHAIQSSSACLFVTDLCFALSTVYSPTSPTYSPTSPGELPGPLSCLSTSLNLANLKWLYYKSAILGGKYLCGHGMNGKKPTWLVAFSVRLPMLFCMSVAQLFIYILAKQSGCAVAESLPADVCKHPAMYCINFVSG